MTTENRVTQYKQIMPIHTRIDLETLNEIGFFTAPASTKYHGAYTGGLFDHSFLTVKSLVELTEKLDLEWERPESPYLVGMYHDLCKCDNYVKDPESDQWIYNPEIIIPGHGDKSIILLGKYFNLTDEEIACIRWHMGAFEDDPKMRNNYGRACEKYHNILFTHTADMIASKILGI